MNYNYKGYTADISLDTQKQLRIVEIYRNGMLIETMERCHTEDLTSTKCGIQIAIDKYIKQC